MAPKRKASFTARACEGDGGKEEKKEVNNSFFAFTVDPRILHLSAPFSACDHPRIKLRVRAEEEGREEGRRARANVSSF